MNPVEALIGDSGVVHYYGGELARDWYDVYMINRVGLDSGVQIREGKNLLGISYDENDTDVITRIMPSEDKDGELLYLPELYGINAIDEAVYVHIALDEEAKHLAVYACDPDEKDALRWCAAKDNKRKSRKMNGSGFADFIYQLMMYDR